ncbi:MAG: hypothetical protein NC293_14055, partial [Roseburia sp.]|nr:hypothetical protein [Roseburia sp.]
MINKKYILSLCLCFSMFALAGCVSSKNLTEEEQDIIAEYSAGILLQNEEKYERKLVKQDIPAAPETTTPPPATAEPETTPVPSSDSATGGDEGETGSEVPLNDIYGMAEIEVRYDSYTVCREYTSEVRAGKGNVLYVAKYKVKNTTSKALKIDLIKRKIAYSLNLDGTSYDAAPSFLKNGGLNYLDTKIKAHSSEEAVLVFEVPEAAKNAASAVLTVQDEEKKAT